MRNKIIFKEVRRLKYRLVEFLKIFLNYFLGEFVGILKDLVIFNFFSNLFCKNIWIYCFKFLYLGIKNFYLLISFVF